MNGLNGIIISGNVYEAIPRDYTCIGCDLTSKCRELWEKRRLEYCEINSDYEFKFRFSQELTDKINEK